MGFHLVLLLLAAVSATARHVRFGGSNVETRSLFDGGGLPSRFVSEYWPRRLLSSL